MDDAETTLPPAYGAILERMVEVNKTLDLATSELVKDSDETEPDDKVPAEKPSDSAN